MTDVAEVLKLARPVTQPIQLQGARRVSTQTQRIQADHSLAQQGGPRRSAERRSSAQQTNAATIRSLSTPAVDRKRVLFVADSLRVGEVEHALVDLAVELVCRGASVQIATSATGPLDAFARRYGVEVVQCGSALVERRFDADFAAGLSTLVRSLRPHVVHSHMFASSVAAAEAIGGSATPLVIHECSEGLWRESDDIAMVAPAYRRAGAVIATSRAVRDRLVSDDGVEEHKIHLLPQGRVPETLEIDLRDSRTGPAVRSRIVDLPLDVDAIATSVISIYRTLLLALT